MKRVLLDNFSPLLHGIITAALSSSDEISLLDQNDGPASPIDAIVMSAVGSDDVAEIPEALWRWPHCRVLVISPSGHFAVLYQLMPTKRVVGDLSPASLVDAICH